MFALSVFLINFTYKVVLCILRRINKAKDNSKDRLYAFWAGFLSGLWLLIYDNPRWNSLLMHFMCSTTLEIGINWYFQDAYSHPDGFQAPHENAETDYKSKNKFVLILFVLGLVSNNIGAMDPERMAESLK